MTLKISLLKPKNKKQRKEHEQEKNITHVLIILRNELLIYIGRGLTMTAFSRHGDHERQDRDDNRKQFAA
jgi:hypothetical protein